MSGSRFVYILFLIFMAFGIGSLTIHNWGTIKSFLPGNLAASSEDVGREAVSVLDRIKTSARDLVFRKNDGEAESYTSPVGAPDGTSSSSSTSSAGPRFSSVLLTRKPGSRFSGNGKPGWQVTVEANGRPLGRTKVNRLGSWEMVVQDPMTENNYKLGIVGRGPGSSSVIERGEDAIVSFMPSDGDSKVMRFSHSGIGAVAVPDQFANAPATILDVPEVKDSKIAALPTGNSGTSNDDDISITDSLIKKASELGAAASDEFTKKLDGLKGKAADGTKLALGPKVAPLVDDKIISPTAPAKDGMSVDKALDKAGELARDAKDGLIGYLDKLGLSDKPASGDVKDPTATTPAVKKPVVKKSFAKLVFDKVDMSGGKGRSGILSLAGRAEPNSIVGIFLGQRSIASVVSDVSGHWVFSGTRNIPYGNNILGAVQRDLTGKILSRTKYTLRRVAPKTVVAVNKPVPDAKKPARIVGLNKPETTAVTPAIKKPVRTYNSDSARRYKKRVTRRKYASLKKRKKRARLARAKKRARNYRRKYRSRMGLGVTSGIPKKARKYRKRRSYGRKLRSRGGCKRGYVRYRVRRGDSLWKISKRFYGNGKRAGRIYRANKRRIKNPNRIYRSQRICVRRR